MDEIEIDVAVDGAVRRWQLREHTRQEEGSGGSYVLTLVADDGRVWTASSSDAFRALQLLREQVEPAVRVGCNGARRNAWSSGMQRDMGLGRTSYLLSLGEEGRAPTAPTLGPAPLDEVVTVREQEEFYAAWLDSRGSQDP